MPINKWSDNILIAEFSNEPAFSEDIDVLFRELDQCEDDLPHVIVNLQGVTRLNSSNLAQLLRLRKRLLINGKGMRMCSVDDKVWSVLLMTGLDAVFEFTDDVSTSLASLQIEE